MFDLDTTSFDLISSLNTMALLGAKFVPLRGSFVKIKCAENPNIEGVYRVVSSGKISWAGSTCIDCVEEPGGHHHVFVNCWVREFVEVPAKYMLLSLEDLVSKMVVSSNDLEKGVWYG